MAEFYLNIRWVHIACVICTGTLFSLRGILMILRSPYANHFVLRWLSYIIDTTLLTAALMLTQIIHQYPFTDSWLTTKVLLLVIYVALGMLALRDRATRPVRIACFIAALLVFITIVGIARAHHPLGWPHLMMG